MLKTAQGNTINVIDSVVSRWQKLGDLLEFDNSGTKLELIKSTYPANPEACCRDMFRHWLNGNGVRPCSWRKLIELLKDCHHKVLAEEIQDALEKEQVQT